MKVAFALDVPNRAGLYNGTAMRGSVGVSGTETNHILLAEQFARHGHEVYYFSPNVIPGEDCGVNYRQTPLPGVSFDFLFDTFLMTAHRIPIRAHHAVLIMQCQTFAPWLRMPEALWHLQQMTGYRKLTFTTQSTWARNSFHFHYPGLKVFKIHVFGNTLDSNIPDLTRLGRNPHFVFNSSFERGGAQFNQIFDRLPIPGKTKMVCSYYTPDGLKSLGKSDLFQELDQADYCLFPLVLPDGRVYQDTYNLACMEALSRGAVCVAPRVETLTCIYGDKVLWVDPPAGHNPDINGPVEVQDPTFLSDEYIQSFVNAILALNANPARKRQMRLDGVTFARNHTAERRYAEYLQAFPELCT